MKTIIKKIDTEWFDLILAGKKKYELRLADFDIEEGDIIRLEEYTQEGFSGNTEGRKPTGRSIEKKVTFLRKTNIKQWIENQPELLEKGFYVIQFD
jgi:ASC-1-like (ASCH) protein